MKPIETVEAVKRKPYVKPQLGRVSLTPQQTVLGNCYSGSTGTGYTVSACAVETICMNSPSPT